MPRDYDDDYPDSGRDRHRAIRDRMLEAIKAKGRPLAANELCDFVGLGAQATTMAAARFPMYFTMSDASVRRRRVKGRNKIVMIDIHPHLKVG